MLTLNYVYYIYFALLTSSGVFFYLGTDVSPDHVK